MSERELRELLQGVVPDPPTMIAGPLAAAGRRARNRRRVVAGAAVAAVIAVAAIVPTLVSGSDPEPETMAPASDDVVSTIPFAPIPSPDPERSTPIQTCPGAAPTVEDDVAPINDLDAVMVIYCATDPPHPTALTPDALVGNPAYLRAAVEAAAPLRRSACLTLSFIPPGFIAFKFEDGHFESVASGCNSVKIGGTTLLGRQLPDVFLAALDRQRDDEAAHSLSVRFLDPADCNLALISGPVDPGRDPLADAVGCASAGEAPLGAIEPGALDLLRERWSEAAPIAADEVDRCVNRAPSVAGSSLVVTTYRGDLVKLTQSPCGYLFAAPTYHQAEPYAVRVTFEELGLG